MLERAGSNIKKAERPVVSRVALFAKETMLAGAASVNTPKKLRSGRSANAYGAKYLFTAENTAVVFLRGAPPYWRERGIDPHTITPRKKKALTIGDGFAASAQHPGVAARPFWAPTVSAIHAGATRVHKAAAAEALLKAGFKGG